MLQAAIQQQVFERYPTLPEGEVAKLLVNLVDCFSDLDHFPQDELMGFSVPTLVDYLKHTHTLYLDVKLPEIEQNIDQLLEGHNEPQVVLALLEGFYLRFRNDLKQHLELEERHLFPYIGFLHRSEEKGFCARMLYHKVNTYSLEQFIADHDDDEENTLREVRHALEVYEPGVLNRSVYRVLLTRLENFERDLSVHARIEDEVLVPKALELEKHLVANKLNAVQPLG